MLGNLDNEIIFKKAFTDKFVLQCVVKDIFGVDFEPAKVETEKRFKPKIAHIDLKYDIFAESKDKRTIVEIQKVDYDYNFDRFLLYHNMAIAEQQRTSKEYKADKLVLTLVVFTDKYNKIKQRNNEEIAEAILLFDTNLKNIKGEKIDVWGHQLTFLNHNYLKNDTPQVYKDWLQLVRESIMNPSEPDINFSNQGVKKVAQLIDYQNLSAEELTESKNRHAAQSVKELDEERAIFKNKIEIATKMLRANSSDSFVAQMTGLSIFQIEALRKELSI